jgi:hypothetical protein
MKSKFFTLSFRDFLKGSIVAILTGIITALTAIVSPDEIDMKRVLFSALIGLLSYLVKNLFTNNKDQFLTFDKK